MTSLAKLRLPPVLKAILREADGTLPGFLPWPPYLGLGYLEPSGLFGLQFPAVKWG